MKKLKILLFTLIFSAVSSCGFLNDEPVKDQDIFISDQLSANCELDPGKFGEILDSDIEAQIECLENNFIQFSRYVRSTDRTTISEGELSDFVRRFFKENTDTVIQGLKLIFELNMLLLKDEADSINRNNITPLFKLLVTVNKEAISITKTLRDMEGEKDREALFEKRETLKKALDRFSKTSLQIIQRPDTPSKQIKLKEFLLGLNDRLNLGSDVIDEKLADAILFIKKLFFGGKKGTLTSSEIEYAIKKLPSIISMAMDFVLVKDIHFNDISEYYDFQSELLEGFRTIIYPLKDNEEIFNFEDLYTLFEKISDDSDFNIRDYEKIFTSLKKDLIGGDSEIFTYKEIKYSLNYISLFIDGLSGYEKHQIITKDIDSKTYDQKQVIKAEFISQVSRLTIKAKNDLTKHGGLPQNVDILNFTKTLNSEIDSFNFNVDFIDAIFGLKIAFAGGKKNLLTIDELCESLNKLDDLASLYFDLRFISKSFKHDSSKKWNFLANSLEDLYPLLIADENVDALEINDITEILKEFFQDDSEHETRVNGLKLSEDEIKAFVETLKTHILTTTPDSINIKEIKSLLRLSHIGISTLEFIKFYSEKADLAKLDPSSVNLFADEVEEKARLLEYLIQRDLPLIVDLNKNLNYLEIADSLSILFRGIEGIKDNETIADIAEILSPLKTIIFGGERETLTFKEILNISSKISSYAKAAFMMTNSDYSDELDNEKFYKNLLDSYIAIEKNLVISDSLNYFEAKELLIAVNWIINSNNAEDSVDFTKFTGSLVNVKGRIIQKIKDPTANPNDYQRAHIFKSSDLSIVLEYIRSGLEVTYFNERTYKAFDKELQSRKPISWLNLSKVTSYPGIRAQNLRSLRLDFLDSIKKYRHYTFKVEKLDTNGKPVTRFIQYLGTEYKRTRFGHVLTSIVKHVFNIALQGYTIKQDNLDVVDIPRINMLFIDLKPVLEEFGLWTSNFKTFGENVILLSDLFQNTSNGDNALGLDEGVEFVTIVLIASSLTDEVMTELKEYCPNRGSEETPAFETSCYRESLFEVWLNKLDYAKMFPKLARYYKDEDRESVVDYIRKTEGFARDVADETIPMAKRDFTLLIGAMLNIESTFVRFDKNNDNVIDTDELDEAFLIYKVSIQKMADLNGWKKALTKTVFYFMVKNMKIPSTSEVLKYHFQLHFNPMYEENIKAKRLNIGALLYNLLQYRQ